METRWRRGPLITLATGVVVAAVLIGLSMNAAAGDHAAPIAASAPTTAQPTIAPQTTQPPVTLPPTTALADRVRFRQIIENLLSNAVKFTPEGGSVTIAAWSAEDQVYVSVADTGVGIVEVDQDRVFEEFQQVGDAERQRSGTGLGLAISKSLVELHGGKIMVDSEVGRGSTFSVRLPAAPPGGQRKGERKQEARKT